MFNTNVIIDVVAINGVVGLAQGIFTDKAADFVSKKTGGKDNLVLIFDNLCDILQNDVTGFNLSIYLQGQSLITVRWILKMLNTGYLQSIGADSIADKVAESWCGRTSARWISVRKLIDILANRLEEINSRQISFKAQTSIYKYEIVGDDMVLEEIAEADIRSLFFRNGYNEEFGLRVPEAPFFSGHLSIEHDGKAFKTYGWLNPRTMSKWQSWLLDIHKELVSKVKGSVERKAVSFIG